MFLVFQVLGPKPSLVEATTDDQQADASNRRLAKLYKVKAKADGKGKGNWWVISEEYKG